MRVNFGDVIVEHEDRYGEDVNIATRLQALADQAASSPRALSLSTSSIG